ncbi:unnamed protein product [Ceratitis capitata]|uniref:(Mediterranean fruit fly) hypothetical protein n=1 Tax=Ceratitis capitata TaxID=7213 RepID=A0A811VF52_CERCA|nr:unnamed protein product [Ceratitis capitata]
MFNGTCCLLCLECSEDQIDLIFKEENGLNARDIIELHFKEELEMMPQIENKVICKICWESIESFHKFYLNVKQVHREAANTLKKFSMEKEEFIRNEDTSPAQRRRTRRPRQPKIIETSKVFCEPTLTLKECEIKIEELILPAASNRDCVPSDNVQEIFVDKDEIGPEVNRMETVASPTHSCADEDEILPEEENLGTSISPTVSDSDDIESDNEEIHVKGKSRNIKKRQSVNKKTAESDEYIAKKNFKLTCSICHISLANFKELKAHFREAHQMRGYVLCCGKKLPNRGLLIDHINYHENPDYFKCKLCGKSMTERRSLELHLQYAHGKRERTHRCTICSKGFFRASCLKQHYYIHVSEEQKTVPCQQCDKTFPDDAELRKHMRLSHLNAYAKICDICGASIKGRYAFERHQAEHSGIPRKLIKCDLCDAALTTKYGLARHMKTMHTEEYQTPQICSICSKLSPNVQAHRNHVKYMHSLERKHVCKLCDKAFKRLTDFKEHMATHTGEALYTCSFCPQTFKSNANMYSHRKKKHAKEWAEQIAFKKSLATPLKQTKSTDQ